MSKNNSLQSYLQGFGSTVGIHQLSEPVAISIQQEYYRLAQQAGSLVSVLGEGRAFVARLLAREADEAMSDDEKIGLVCLAHKGEVEMLSPLDDALEVSTGELRSWLLLARLDLQLKIMNSLLDEQQVVLSSGLGGRGNLLRLQGFCLGRDLEPWQSYQRDVLSRELRTMCASYGGEVEDELWGDNYYIYTILLPYQTPLEDAIREFISSSNEYGNFIHPENHVTNVSPITHDTVQTFIEKMSHPTRRFVLSDDERAEFLRQFERFLSEEDNTTDKSEDQEED